MRLISLILISLIGVFVTTSCDPVIIVTGQAEHDLSATALTGQVSANNKRGIPGVKVILRAKENPQHGFKAITNDEGAYKISGIITAVKSGWNWSEGWELVFEKEGYETTIIELENKKHKDPEGTMKWRYKVDAVLNLKK